MTPNLHACLHDSQPTCMHAGAMKYLAERYDLTKIPMVGASGGAIAATLAACGVDADRIMQHAYDLSIQHNIWERPLGLLGVWGSLVEQWLDDLLPEDAHERCRGRITIIITKLPDMGQVGGWCRKSGGSMVWGFGRCEGMGGMKQAFPWPYVWGWCW